MTRQPTPRRGASGLAGTSRRGVTLLEMLAVVSLLGILAAVSIGHFSRQTLGNAGARGEARRLALDLLQAQRRAIATGANHYVQFTPASGAATSYTLYKRVGASSTAVEAARTVPTAVTLTSSHNILEFTFDGAALAAYSVSIVGTGTTCTLSVTIATGAVKVTETP